MLTDRKEVHSNQFFQAGLRYEDRWETGPRGQSRFFRSAIAKRPERQQRAEISREIGRRQ